MKIGLALGGGVARGLAHIGVIDVLQKEGIPIDMISGTSMGAIIGAIYAKTKDAEMMAEKAIEFGSHRLKYFSDFTIPKTGVIKGRRIENELTNIIGANTTFSNLRIPFSCVAVDLDKGEEVILNRGKVWKAVRASSSIPGLFSLLKWQNRYLIDGGVLNPIPVNAVKNLGADVVIAVNVLPRKAPVDKREPNIFTVLIKSFYIMDSRFIKESLSGADTVIEPDVSHISFSDFHRAEECIESGAKAARKIIPELKQRLSVKI